MRNAPIVALALGLGILAAPAAAADLCGTWRGTSTFAGFKARKDMEVLPYSLVISNCNRPQPSVMVQGTNSDGRPSSGYAKDVQADDQSISYSTLNPSSGLAVSFRLRLEKIDGKDWLVGTSDVESVRGRSNRDYKLERVSP